MKIHEYVASLGTHAIYDSVGLSKDFKKQTGKEPHWPVHSPAATRKAIRDRGLGGSLTAEKPCAYGWEIAEGLADRYAPDQKRVHKFGRGSRFWVAVEALKKADV